MVIRGTDRSDASPYPSIARLSITRLDNSKDRATGVFVSSNVFLTAAHVLHSPDRKKRVSEVRIRTHDPATGNLVLREDREGLHRDAEMTTRFRIHPDYSMGENDVAVFRINGTIERTAVIASQASLDSGFFDESFVGVSGWGKKIRGARLDWPKRAQFAAQFVAEETADIQSESDVYYQPGRTSPQLADVLSGDLFHVSNLSNDARQGPCPGDSGGGVFLGKPESAVSDPTEEIPSHVLFGLVSHSSLERPPEELTPAERLEHYSRTDLTVACTNLLKFRAWLEKAVSEVSGEPLIFH